MEKLVLNSVINIGKKEYKISDLVNVSGKILSLIKDGYEFEDEVLESAHIIKTIRDEKYYFTIKDNVSCQKENEILPIETASVKQILSELNTIDVFSKNNTAEGTNYTTDDEDKITIENFEENDV